MHCNPSVLKLQKCGKITLLDFGNQMFLFILLNFLLQLTKPAMIALKCIKAALNVVPDQLIHPQTGRKSVHWFEAK